MIKTGSRFQCLLRKHTERYVFELRFVLIDKRINFVNNSVLYIYETCIMNSTVIGCFIVLFLGDQPNVMKHNRQVCRLIISAIRKKSCLIFLKVIIVPGYQRDPGGLFLN